MADVTFFSLWIVTKYWFSATLLKWYLLKYLHLNYLLTHFKNQVIIKHIHYRQIDHNISFYTIYVFNLLNKAHACVMIWKKVKSMQLASFINKSLCKVLQNILSIFSFNNHFKSWLINQTNLNVLTKLCLWSSSREDEKVKSYRRGQRQ